MTSVATPVAAREPAPGHSIGNITSECLVRLISINSILGHSLVGGERENLLRWARDMLVLGPPGSGLEYRLRLSPGLKQSYLDALHCILESLRSSTTSQGTIDADGLAERGQALKQLLKENTEKLVSLSARFYELHLDAKSIRVVELNPDSAVQSAIQNLRDYTRGYLAYRFRQQPNSAFVNLFVDANVERLRWLCALGANGRCRVLGSDALPNLDSFLSCASKWMLKPGDEPVDPDILKDKNRYSEFRVQQLMPGAPEKTCMYCGFEFSEKPNKVAWRKHLFEDLEPIHCIPGHCQTEHGTVQTFSQRQDWVSHMQNAHNKLFYCGYCYGMVFEDRDEYVEHSRSLHYDVTRSHYPKFAWTCLTQFRTCPFCEFRPLQADAAYSNEEYQEHLEIHFMEVALLAIHHLPTRDGQVPEAKSWDKQDVWIRYMR